jgi:hypothetical protein
MKMLLARKDIEFGGALDLDDLDSRWDGLNFEIE